LTEVSAWADCYARRSIFFGGQMSDDTTLFRNLRKNIRWCVVGTHKAEHCWSDDSLGSNLLPKYCRFHIVV